MISPEETRAALWALARLLAAVALAVGLVIWAPCVLAALGCFALGVVAAHPWGSGDG